MTAAKEPCDLLVHGGRVVTMDTARRYLADGAVAVKGTRIAAVGASADLKARFSPKDAIDAKGGFVHPGYVEAHLHVNAQTCRGYFRGDSAKGGRSGPNYADWKAALTPDDERAAAMLAGVEMLRHGVTAYVEPGSAFDPDAVADAAVEVGIRCSLSDPYLWDDVSALDAIPGLRSDALLRRVPADRDRCLKLLGGQLHRNGDRDGILHGHVALYGEGTASDELYRAAKRLADEAGVVLNSHIGFDLQLAEVMERVWKKPRFVHLQELGVLGPNATFVHMNLIRDEEIDAVKASGVSLVWCPLAYMTRGTPLRHPTRLPALWRQGVNVGLGTDSARQSSAGDAAYLATLLANEIGAPFGAEDALEMQTVGGARAAGLHDEIGSLEPGKRADIVVRAQCAETFPGFDPAHQLVMVAHGPTASTVVVNGRVVLDEGRAIRVDERAVFETARRSAEGLAIKLRLPPSSKWMQAPSF